MRRPSDPIRTLIVDDEPIARRGIRRLLAADAGIEVIGECGDGRSAAQIIDRADPDLVLLDIQMPGLDGFQCLRAVRRSPLPVIVFLTAWEQYAVQAFEAQAIDYLLKPFADQRFATALARAKGQVVQRRNGSLEERLTELLARVTPGDPADRSDPASPAPVPGSPYLTRIGLRSTRGLVFLDVAEIDWVEAADYVVRLHTRNGAHVLRESLRTLESQLDPSRFLRVHRSAIVNLDRIREVQPYFHGRHVIILQNGAKVMLSRSRRRAFGKRLGRPL